MQDIAQWPAGATYVAQGTVAEDATAGTHVCSLTVTPGAGNEMQLLYGDILTGNTATSTSANVFIDDGTNRLTQILRGTTTTALTEYGFPEAAAVTGATGGNYSGIAVGTIISGGMRLVLNTSTAAVSVTQTFAVVGRTRGGKPSSVLADTVGAPVLTLNTDKLF